MLDAIYRIGVVQGKNKTADGISSLLTTITTKHVVGIIFENKNGKVKYKKSELFEFQKPFWYLFNRDYSGRPGLFLTGNISGQNIDKIKKIMMQYSTKSTRLSRSTLNNTQVKKFIEDKILWFPNGKLVNNSSLVERLNYATRSEVLGILGKFRSNNTKIAKDVLKILTKDHPERILLTIMIHRNGKNKPKFVGQINSYREFFKRGVLSKKYHDANQQGKIMCSICNNKRYIETFTEKPLPFYIADKPMFFPDADPLQSRKGFPVCDDCYLELQKGTQFIQDKLNFRIPSLGSMEKSELNFWLIPHLNDQKLIIDFKNELSGNKDLYLNSLKELCSTLRSIAKHDHHERKDVESFLRFSALFYSYDSHVIMRVISYIQGIYPAQLERLFEVKDKIDGQYPFPILSEKLNQQFSFGFPLLVMFYKEIESQWQTQVISVMEKIFTAQQIPLDEIVQNIVLKARDTSTDLRSLTRTIFLGLVLLEYLINLNEVQISTRGKEMSERAVEQEEQEEQDEKQPIIEDIGLIQKFIESHKGVLVDDTSRAVFAIGVCVGILLEVQELLYNKTGPFWNRLNRLDLDLKRIVQMFPEVKSKLAMYNERTYDTIINYLATNEISKINIQSPLSWTSENTSHTLLSKEKLNFIFSIGLSFGSMLKRGFLR